jgi:hypothetical protein
LLLFFLSVQRHMLLLLLLHGFAARGGWWWGADNGATPNSGERERWKRLRLLLFSSPMCSYFSVPFHLP